MPNVHRYTLEISEQADVNLHRLAMKLGIKEVDVLRNAINTYATLKHDEHDSVWIKTRDAHGKLVIKRLAVP